MLIYYVLKAVCILNAYLVYSIVHNSTLGDPIGWFGEGIGPEGWRRTWGIHHWCYPSQCHFGKMSFWLRLTHKHILGKFAQKISKCCQWFQAKVNEMSRTLVVSSFQHRSFGREQWLSLHHRLQSLIANLRVSHSNIKNVTQAVDASA